MKLNITELAALDQLMTLRAAESAMPPPVQLEVLDARMHQARGYVICKLAFSHVRCIVPINIDLSAANGTEVKYILWALPITGKASVSGNYIAIGLAWDGVTNSRSASISTPSVAMPAGGSAPDTPASGVTMYSSETQLIAKDADGSEVVLNDDLLQWLSML